VRTLQKPYTAVVRLLSHLVFVALAVACLYAGVLTTLGVFRLVDKPFPGLSLIEEGLVNPVGLSSWGGGRAGFRMWDRILAVDGELVFHKDDIMARALDRPVGATAVYQVVGLDGSERFVELQTRLFTPSDLIRSHTTLALLGLIFIVVAILLYGLRVGTPEAWAFFLFFAALGIVMVSVVDMTVLWRLPPLFPAVAPFLGVLGFILVSVITRAYTRTDGTRLLEGRPEPGEPGFVEEHRPRRQRLQLRVVMASGVGLVVSALVSSLMLQVGSERARYAVIDNVFYSWLAICALACFALLVLAYRRGRSPRRRARIRQILWAWPVGAGIPIINLFCGHVLELWPMSQIWNAFLLLVPLSTADAIVRHDLLRLNDTARRLVGGITVAAAVGVVLGFVLWGAVTTLKLDDASAMVALAAVLFAVAAPLTHQIQSHVESLLRQTAYDAGRLAASFTAKASTSNRLDDVVAELLQVTRRSIRPLSLEVWRLDAAQDGVTRLVPLLSKRRPILVEGAVLQTLDHSEPQVCDDEQPAPAVFGDASGEAAIIVRLAVAGEPVGLMVLGERSDGKPYEGTDVAFVGSLAGPLAAALVSTLAFEAVERLNLELEARVQTRTAELAQKNDELAELNQRKDELVASVSHDFRSPLAIIRQNVQTVLRDLGSMDKDDLKMFLQAIGRQEARLTSMCTNLLDLARLKQRESPRDPVDLRSLARMISDGFSSRAASKGVSLRLELEDRDLIVAGDVDRLGQLVQNLVDNALKFTPDGGTIVLGITALGNDAVTLVVQDSGIGVPENALSRVFEPFFQVPNQSFVGQGSGLGLAIVKAVVDAHGGAVVVDSTEGSGTRFVVTLPRFVGERSAPQVG
jgi:signal transduction histidine kinase